jgi:hypothetical protein
MQKNEMENQLQRMLVPVVRIYFRFIFNKLSFVFISGDLDESGDFDEEDDDNSEDDGTPNKRFLKCK